MGAPLMKAEQNSAIRVEDLTKVVVGGSRLRQAKQRLVPREAASTLVLSAGRGGRGVDVYRG
jgi:hypothetical protein